MLTNIIQSIIKTIIFIFKDHSSFEIPKASAKPTVEDQTPWMTTAVKEIGQKEIIGATDNKRIDEYQASTTLSSSDISDDKTPWCSAFVTWCLKQSGYKSTESAWARSYLNYGVHLDKPIYGCIVIYNRGNGLGHVHFFDHEDSGIIYGLGGNQSNSVCLKGYNKSDVLGYRMPVK